MFERVSEVELESLLLGDSGVSLPSRMASCILPGGEDRGLGMSHPVIYGT